MAFLTPTLGITVRRVVSCGLLAIIGCMAAAASEATAARPPRAERIASRRLERIEVIERRAETAAEMPPRPADVRRMVRRGVPLSEIMPKNRNAGPAAAPAPRTAAAKTPATAKNATAARPAAPAARLTTPTPPAATAATAQAQPTAPPRPFAPAPAATPAATEPPLRFPEQPVTAIDDGTRSVLVREEPTPAPPAELLPTPQPKN